MESEGHVRTAVAAKAPLLQGPTFAVVDAQGVTRRPTTGEALREWLDAINCIGHPERTLNVLNLLFQLGTLAVAVIYFRFHVSLASLCVLTFSVVLFGVVYNTVWYHRYCSHRAFQFRHAWFAKLFLWSNPLVLREEVYALPHRAHHRFADTPLDPHGPHLGWLGSFLAHESLYKINTTIGEGDYTLYRRSLAHIGLQTSSYRAFLKTGSIEHVGWYTLRTVVAQCGWAGLMFYLGGLPFVTAWYTAIALTWLLIRDFQWRGHGAGILRDKKPGWEFDRTSSSLNQYFYGYVAGEWHDNHHCFPASANNGFRTGQPDAAFLVIRLLHWVGVVRSYIDSAEKFRRAANPVQVESV